MFQQQLSMLDQLAYQQLMFHMVNDVGLRDGASENLGKRFGVIIKGQILLDIFKRPLWMFSQMNTAKLIPSISLQIVSRK